MPSCNTAEQRVNGITVVMVNVQQDRVSHMRMPVGWNLCLPPLCDGWDLPCSIWARTCHIHHVPNREGEYDIAALNTRLNNMASLPSHPTAIQYFPCFPINSIITNYSYRGSVLWHCSYKVIRYFPLVSLFNQLTRKELYFQLWPYCTATQASVKLLKG